MTAHDGDLATFHEIAVVLGGGLRDDGSPTASTLARADTAARLAHERPGLGLICSGRYGDLPPAPERTEAALMAERIRKAGGVDARRVFVEEESRDTLSNAVCVAERYLARIAPRRLFLVTSPFHMERSLWIFRRVLGPSWPVEPHPCPPTTGDVELAKNERRYLDEVRAFLADTAPGDVGRIAAKVRARSLSSFLRRP